jgi:hypothetical protein
MARVVVAEFRGFADKKGTMDDGTAWAHRRINLEDEAGNPLFVKIKADEVADYVLPAKGTQVAYLVDRYDRVERQLPDADALAQYLGLTPAV